jgi:hypothetical protein
MNGEIAYIIKRMAPIELVMLEERGMVLPPNLHCRALAYRQSGQPFAPPPTASIFPPQRSERLERVARIDRGERAV